MNREKGFEVLGRRDEIWDILVVGGGATGLGAAVDAASRGLRVLLVERGDFASGTSSRSTKLIHGGVRYLRQGNMGLVREGLRERGLLWRNAPHWVRPLPFVIPVRGKLEWAFYRLGLGFYDFLGGSRKMEGASTISGEEMVRLFPRMERGLGGEGVRYVDGQFDDAAFAIRLAQEGSRLGGTLLNYVELAGLELGRGRVARAMLRDVDAGGGGVYEVQARVVINAAGIFSDEVRRRVEPGCEARLRFSQGTHVVLDGDYLGGEAALMIPRTEDGRVLFAIPWHGRTLFGTTDVQVMEAERRPRATAGELDYLLKHASHVFGCAVRREDVRSCFSGIRPLLDSGGSTSRATSTLSRDHRIEVLQGGMVTIAGGKWTSYRRMAEEVVDCAVRVGGLRAGASVTAAMRLGRDVDGDLDAGLRGMDGERLVEGLPWTWGDVRRACGMGMARTLEDVLARRTRLLFTDVVEARRVAPRVAEVMASDRGLGRDWIEGELASLDRVAADFLPL